MITTTLGFERAAGAGSAEVPTTPAAASAAIRAAMMRTWGQRAGGADDAVSAYCQARQLMHAAVQQGACERHCEEVDHELARREHHRRQRQQAQRDQSAHPLIGDAC